MKIDKDREYNGYYLNIWGDNFPVESCNLCELSNECDRLADELNNIEFAICLSDKCIKDIQYKKENTKSYFKKIQN